MIQESLFMTLTKPVVSERVNIMPVDGHSMETRNLSAYYGSKLAIENVNLVIPAKRVTALIGPSGCGKSTLIRTFNRMHEVVRGARVTGEVLLDGDNIYAPDVDPVKVRRLVGMVFQKPNPFPMMSVYDNVVAGLKLEGVRDKRLLDETAERCLKQAALGMRSRTSCMRLALPCPVASSSASASRGLSPSSRK